jgi:hypothetical protein
MYRLTFEYGHPNAFPRYFDPAQPRLAFAETWAEALKNARRVIGQTRKANLDGEMDPSVVERRRNRRYIVTIRDVGNHEQHKSN